MQTLRSIDVSSPTQQVALAQHALGTGAPSEGQVATQPIRIVHGLVVDAQRRPGDPLCRLGDLVVIAELARGGMGGVFLARDRHGRECALKVLDPQFAVHPAIVARMYGELDVSRRVRHRGLLEISGIGCSAEGVPYLVMEYLDGENLGSLVDKGRLELGAVSAIGAQVAEALAALHRGGVVHCDLKPDNIHVLYEAGVAGWPRTKVLDFGVAKILDAVIEDEPSIAGTPAYMAPEQWRGEAVRESDVYALGCVLYELCTGAPPFGGSVPELMTLHCEAMPIRAAARRPGLRADLDQWISRMLAKDPGLRPRMAEVARALAAIAEALPSPEMPKPEHLWILSKAC
jgi:eukaryotic-like serine/threonine-protein kinase